MDDFFSNNYIKFLLVTHLNAHWEKLFLISFVKSDRARYLYKKDYEKEPRLITISALFSVGAGQCPNHLHLRMTFSSPQKMISYLTCCTDSGEICKVIYKQRPLCVRNTNCPNHLWKNEWRQPDHEHKTHHQHPVDCCCAGHTSSPSTLILLSIHICNRKLCTGRNSTKVGALTRIVADTLFDLKTTILTTKKPAGGGFFWYVCIILLLFILS